MANYVKFLRGTPQAYQSLGQYDSDTLYFICEKDANDGVLYLGSKLISGGEIGDFSIGDLKDIIVNEVGDKQILVYSSDAGAWVNVDYGELIENFVGATEGSSGVAGLVPAPDKGKTNLFLRSDGVWAEVTASASGDNTIFSVINDLNLGHETLIRQATADEDVVVGDIFIVKDIIVTGKYQHTAYVYNGSAWAALDGNYNAANVYFDEDFTFTESVGTVEIPETGSVVVPAAGLNMKEFFATLFAEERDPETTQPTVSIALSPNITSYEVGSICTPKYKVAFEPGSYTFGPETEVVASVVVTDTNANSSTNMIDTFAAFTVEDDTEYRISAVTTHGDGTIPVTNLGNFYEDGQIKSGTLDIVHTSYVRGYRNCFYGTLPEKEELTSDIIRGLSKTNQAVTTGTAITISIPVGAKRIVLAYPSSVADLTSVKDVNGINAEIVSSFECITLEVEGANDYDAIEYKVYILDYANGADEANIYKVTI